MRTLGVEGCSASGVELRAQTRGECVVPTPGYAERCAPESRMGVQPDVQPAEARGNGTGVQGKGAESSSQLRGDPGRVKCLQMGDARCQAQDAGTIEMPHLGLMGCTPPY